MAEMFEISEINYIPDSEEKILNMFNIIDQYMNKEYDEVFQVYKKNENKVVLRTSKGLGFFMYISLQYISNEGKDVRFHNNKIEIKVFCEKKFSKTKEGYTSSGNLLNKTKESIRNILTKGFEPKEVGKVKVNSDFRDMITIMWLGLCFPIGLYRMWKDGSFNLKIRIGITFILLSIWSLVLFGK